MDILKQELERKRKQIEKLESTAQKKYLKRGELEKVLEKEQQETLNKQKKQKNNQKEAAQLHQNNTTTPVANPSNHTSTNNNNNNNNEDDDDDIQIAPHEITKRLRARGEPIRLFAETDKERLRRLRILEGQEERTEGQRNDFRKAMESTDTQNVLEMFKKQNEYHVHGKKRNGNGDNNGENSNNGDHEDEEEDAEDDYETMMRNKKSKKDGLLDSIDTSEISTKLYQMDPENTRMLIHVYFKRLLRDWGIWLNERPDDIKQSTQGKLQMATQKQSIEYMRPFFKRLKRGVVEENVVFKLAEICEFMQKREYVNANDVYLRLSIGNAPWPIGVTMVGIHERSGREKINANQIAHVLNDETQRKWIQTIKRLMTFAQNKYPPANLTQRVG